MEDPERLIHMLQQSRPAEGLASPEVREENLCRLLRAALPLPEAPEALQERVRTLSPAPPRARASWPKLFPPALRWAAVAALLIVLLVAPFRQPHRVAAAALRRMQTAIQDARSMHETHWRLAPDGRRIQLGETWYQQGKWRLEDRERGQIDVFNGGRIWTYTTKTNQVTVRSTSGPFGYNPSGFSLAAMQRDFARWGWHNQVRLLGKGRANGRPVWQFAIEQPRSFERQVLQVDATTDLPQQTEFQRLSEGRWITEAAARYEYNRLLPAALFEPRFPASARRIDWDREREVWRRRLERGIARQEIARRRIVLRNLWVNADGDVFLLYTAGKTPGGIYGDWKVELTDDLGTRYQEATGLDPYLSWGRAKPANVWSGFTFGGERLKGKWWVPVAGYPPQVGERRVPRGGGAKRGAGPRVGVQPRQFTLTFHAVPIDHPMLPAGAGQPEPGEETYAVRGTFRMRVTRTGETVAPPYMPFMASQMDEDQIRRQEAEAHAEYYRRQAAAQSDAGSASLRQADLARALACYQEIARVDEKQAKAAGSSPHDPGLWTNIGRLLCKLDRKEEARAAFERAIREAISNDWSREEPEALRKGVTNILAWQPGKPAPLVAGLDLDGRTHGVAEYRGRVLLIGLWNRFSHELPLIKSLDRRYGSAGLAVLGVCVDVDREGLRQFIAKQGVPWPNLYDDKQYRSEVGGRFGYSWDLTRLPRTILVDRRGIVRHLDQHGAALEKAVAELMSER
jgi:outer membrane lipoprotein-sorting protein